MGLLDHIPRGTRMFVLHRSAIIIARIQMANTYTQIYIQVVDKARRPCLDVPHKVGKGHRPVRA